MTEINSNIETAVKLLNADELVAIPTETVYGLAGNAFSEAAIKKIFTLKRRPSFNPLIVHISSIDELDKVAINIPPLALKLANEFWPGPLTLLLEKKEIIPNSITAGSNLVAVRIPNHPVALELLSRLSFPLAAPSANPFMSISPTKPEHVKKYFDGKLLYILDGGACEAGIESTIIGFEDNQAVIYRLGSCESTEIEKITGKLLLAKNSSKKPQAPGMLKRHYAPKTPIILTANYKNGLLKFGNKKVAVLTFAPVKSKLENVTYKCLSENESLKDAASSFLCNLN